jgi:hypothetical protein
MSMPEAAMYEDDCLATRKHKVWLPRKAVAVETKSISQAVNESAHS